MARMVRVPANMVGVANRKFGKVDPRDKYPIRVFGSPGIQAAVVPPGHVCPPQSSVEISLVSITTIPVGTIGVVLARHGSVMPSSQGLARGVECNSFQDAERFLLNGGQRGRQPDVLGSGEYCINPYLFDVLTVDTIGEGRHGLTADDLKEIAIPAGSVGVVVALEGAYSADDNQALGRRLDGHAHFQNAAAFLAGGGERGVQEESLTDRRAYRINPWLAKVVLIPTRDLILEWSSAESKTADNYDVRLGPVMLNIEGYRLCGTMAQVIRIPARSAPALVQRFGAFRLEVAYTSFKEWDIGLVALQRFIEKVLGQTVDLYFIEISQDYRIDDFFRLASGIRANLEDKVRGVLADWGVEAARTTLGQFVSEDGKLEEILKQAASDRLKVTDADQPSFGPRTGELPRRQVPDIVASSDPWLSLDPLRAELLVPNMTTSVGSAYDPADPLPRGHVFISYAREDSQHADRLQRKFEIFGLRVWRDTSDLWPGEDWQANIRRAITTDALAFVACFSRASISRRKSYHNAEIALAIEQLRQLRPTDSWFIPVRLDDCEIPELEIGGGRTLGSIHRIDIFGQESAENIDKLTVAILRLLGKL